MLNTNKKTAGIACIVVIIATSLVHVSFGSESVNTIATAGTIVYWPQVDITVNVNEIIGTNKLSLGFHTDWHRWKNFIDSPVQQQLAQEAGFKLVRVFDFRKTAQYGIPDLMPCTYWDEATKTGTWDWTQIDSLTQKIFEIGAEPLFCLGWAYHIGDIQRFLPSGMAINSITGLPYPESYAAYASEWVKHFNTLGLPVRFYQIMNEPYFYFGWNGQDITRLGYYVELWNTAARAMRQQNSGVLLSSDAITQKNVLDYWLIHGDRVDFVDFHKYDADNIGDYSDAQMLSRAERIKFTTTTSYYGIADARQIMLDAWGKQVIAINSESNFNSAWDGGTDPKIQQMIGATWLALVLRTGIISGLDYNIYFELTSPKEWQESQGMGWGFGMINDDDNEPWYPYYVNYMIGANLALGDTIVNAEASSEDIRSVAWIHNEKLNIILICKVDETRAITLQGVNGETTVYWIDNTVSYETPAIQTSVISSAEPLIMNGYTVALLQFEYES